MNITDATISPHQLSISENYTEHLKKKELDRINALNISVLYVSKNWVCDKKQFEKLAIFGIKKHNWRVIQTEHNRGFVYIGIDTFFTFSIKGKILNIHFYGSHLIIEQIIDTIDEIYEPITSVVEWVYSSEGYSIEIPIDSSKIPVNEMYPFINESLESYYQRFIDSSANILVLIGPPGTGKTTWIKGLLNYYGKSARVTYDPAILSKDYIFADFLESESHVLVIEDADSFLGSRSDGNTMMHKFLNVGDGLVTVRGKKLIFSTNLPSIKDIDPALVRPGRCFDVLHFEELSREAALKLCDAKGMEYPKEVKNKYTLAELFHTQNSKKEVRRMGFV